jgi:hypothetical protein
MVRSSLFVMTSIMASATLVATSLLLPAAFATPGFGNQGLNTVRGIPPEANVIGCPPGFVPFFNQAAHRWICLAIGDIFGSPL